MKKILFLFAIAFGLSSCEKDDICDSNTSTTPRLIIEFYDKTNTTDLKNVTSLLVIGYNLDLPLATPLATFNGVSTIELPLKTTDDSTKYSLTLNSNSTTNTNNEDLLQFNYTRNNVYVSRACGYKTVYELNATNGVVLTDSATADDSWIQSSTIVTNTIANENETHIKIYF